jgi:hypothetical protein
VDAQGESCNDDSSDGEQGDQVTHRREFSLKAWTAR